jgi:hypothetical protein
MPAEGCDLFILWEFNLYLRGDGADDVEQNKKVPKSAC